MFNIIGDWDLVNNGKVISYWEFTNDSKFIEDDDKGTWELKDNTVVLNYETKGRATLLFEHENKLVGEMIDEKKKHRYLNLQRVDPIQAARLKLLSKMSN